MVTSPRNIPAGEPGTGVTCPFPGIVSHLKKTRLEQCHMNCSLTVYSYFDATALSFMTDLMRNMTTAHTQKKHHAGKRIRKRKYTDSVFSQWTATAGDVFLQVAAGCLVERDHLLVELLFCRFYNSVLNLLCGTLSNPNMLGVMDVVP